MKKRTAAPRYTIDKLVDKLVDAIRSGELPAADRRRLQQALSRGGRPASLMRETRFALADRLMVEDRDTGRPALSEIEAARVALRMDFPEAAIDDLLPTFLRGFRDFKAGRLKRHIGGPSLSRKK